MNQAWLTGIQALQLIGIGPCILLLSILILALREPLWAITPLLFLLSLISGFIAVLSPLLDWQNTDWHRSALTIASEAFPACAFLLMMQFLRGKLPSPIFWLVLLMPLIGSVGLIYISALSEGDVCISTSGTNISCFQTEDLHSIYSVIVGGIIMLLMMLEMIRSRSFFILQKSAHRDQYWLIISLVLLTVTLLVIELAKLAEGLQVLQGLWGSTLIRLAFVFLMFFSFFRVFGNQYMIAVERVPTADKILSANDRLIAAKLEKLLEEEKLYREMGFTRTDLAEKLGVAESRLSNIINRYFNCNFNIWLNRKRVEEAKLRLRSEPKTQITMIAFESGFNSIATFNRVFKEMTGVSPSEWRNGQKEEGK